MGQDIYQIIENCFRKQASKYIQTLIIKQTWTVLSGIVEENKTLETFECISFATGTRSDDLDEKGIRLHDSHAEILARRAAVRYGARFQFILIFFFELGTYDNKFCKFCFNSPSKSSTPLIVSWSTFRACLKNMNVGVFLMFKRSQVSGLSFTSILTNLTPLHWFSSMSNIPWLIRDIPHDLDINWMTTFSLLWVISWKEWSVWICSGMMSYQK